MTQPELQLAIDGAWEAAVVLPLAPSSRGAVATWLSQARSRSEGALEVLFTSGGQHRLIGVRSRGAELDLLESFMMHLIDQLGGHEWGAIVDMARAHFPVGVFEPGNLHTIEIGVFNAWRLYPVRRLWTSGDAGPDPKVIADVGVSPGTWPGTPGIPLLLEGSGPSPLQHWCGVTVCAPIHGRLVVDRRLVELGVQTILDAFGPDRRGEGDRGTRGLSTR